MCPHIFGSFLGFHQEWRKVRSFSCQKIPCSLHGGLMHSLTLCCCRAIPKHYLEQAHMGRCPSEPGRAAITEHMISGLRVTALSGREVNLFVKSKKTSISLCRVDALNDRFLLDKSMVTISPPTLPIRRRKLTT